VALFTPVSSNFFSHPPTLVFCLVFRLCGLGILFFLFFSFGFVRIFVNQGRLYIATFTTVSTINKMPATQDKPRKAWIQPEDLPDLDTDSDSETSEESFWDYKGSDGSSQTEYSDLEDLADEESEEEEEVSRLVPFGHVFGPLLSSFRTKFTRYSKSLCKKTTKTSYKNKIVLRIQL
jgi:hypothetical protein